MGRQETQSILGQFGPKVTIGQRILRLTVGARGFVRKQPLGAGGLAVCLIVFLGAAFAPFFERYPPNLQSAAIRLQAPSAQHWLGTDPSGRDQWSRIVHGSRISLTVALGAVGIGISMGYLLGIVSGFVGGRTDDIIQRFVDALLAIPTILLALIMVSVLGSGIEKVIFAIAFGSAPGAVRVSRGVVLSLKQNVYVDAARVVGASNLRIMLRHILPNSMAPYLILASVGLGGAILAEASLSYLGLGVPPPFPSWGRMLSGNTAQFAMIAPWLMIVPGTAIMILVLAFNLFGDAVRDVLDPKLRGR